MVLCLGLDACAQGHECQHECVRSGNSYICKCQPGYTLNTDQKTCTRKKVSREQAYGTSCSNDLQKHCHLFFIKYFAFLVIDSCAQGHNCEHSCINSGASYICKCPVGYMLNEDKKTCSRKNRCVFFAWTVLSFLRVNQGLPPTPCI